LGEAKVPPEHAQAVKFAIKDFVSPFVHLLGPQEIADKHAALGWLGDATSTPSITPNSRGWYQHFQNGSIYYIESRGAFEVHGAIFQKWASLGWEASLLGFPLTDESTTPDGVGRYNHFEGGSIYWSPSTGAWEIHGDIRGRYAALGWEASFLGYPISDEHDGPNSTRVSDFQRGQIGWSASSGAAVSATTFEPGAGGGLHPLGLGGAAGSDAPEVRRRVTINAHMELTDDETFGSNEHNSGDKSGEVVVTNGSPQEIINMVTTAGGEMRVEMPINVQAKSNGDAKATGQAKLYEGTSEQTDDLDGTLDTDFLIPRDGIVSKSYTIRNTDEGGDFAVITLTASNWPA
jgi:LGFP repeat-containing protein